MSEDVPAREVSLPSLCRVGEGYAEATIQAATTGRAQVSTRVFFVCEFGIKTAGSSENLARAWALELLSHRHTFVTLRTQ